MADVIEINDIEALDAYRLTWNALLAETPTATFFHTPDWLSVYWRHFGQGQKLRVLVVRAAGRPIGVVPLCVRAERRRVGLVRTLSYPLDGWGNTFGPIGSNQTAALLLAMRHVAQTPRDWDRVELGWVLHESVDRGRTARGMQLAGLRPAVEEHESSSVVTLPDSWEEYLAGRNAKVRHELRRQRRRINEAGHVEYVRRRPAPAAEGDGQPHWDVYQECERVAAASWQSRVTDGNTLTHAEYRDYYRDAHAAAARLGMVDMTVMRVDGQPVAFSYNHVRGGRVLGLRMGYDGGQPYRGAGVALLSWLLEDSCRRGDEEIDLGIGGQDFKRRVRTSQRRTHRLKHVPATSLRCQALRMGGWLRRGAAGESAATKVGA